MSRTRCVLRTGEPHRRIGAGILDEVIALTGMGRPTARRMLTSPALPDPGRTGEEVQLTVREGLRTSHEDARAAARVTHHASRKPRRTRGTTPHPTPHLSLCTKRRTTRQAHRKLPRRRPARRFVHTW